MCRQLQSRTLKRRLLYWQIFKISISCALLACQLAKNPDSWSLSTILILILIASYWITPPSCLEQYHAILANTMFYWTSLCRSLLEWTFWWNISSFTEISPPGTVTSLKTTSWRFLTLASGVTNTPGITLGFTAVHYFRCDGWPRKHSTHCILRTKRMSGHTGSSSGNFIPTAAIPMPGIPIKKPLSRLGVCNCSLAPMIAPLGCSGWCGSVGKKALRIDLHFPRLVRVCENGPAILSRRAISFYRSI